jgi:hypothetical protein
MCSQGLRVGRHRRCSPFPHQHTAVRTAQLRCVCVLLPLLLLLPLILLLLLLLLLLPFNSAVAATAIASAATAAATATVAAAHIPVIFILAVADSTLTIVLLSGYPCVWVFSCPVCLCASVRLEQLRGHMTHPALYSPGQIVVKQGGRGPALHDGGHRAQRSA